MAMFGGEMRKIINPNFEYQEEITMVTIITGNKGSGKTKQLIARVQAAAEQSDGNVICIEKKQKLTYDIPSRVRLIATDDYAIAGYDAFYGFLCGIAAGDHDITDIFVDATLRIGTRDYDTLAVFLKKVSKLSESAEKNITFTVSANEEELPAEIFSVCEK
jgi:energy-coupling factor transporter ATP-binding protein EcfA2